MKKTYKIFLVFLLLFTVAARAYAQPAGATMANPVNLGTLNTCNGAPYTSVMNNNPANNYGNEYGQPSHDIYYKFVLTNSSKVYISLCGSDFDTYAYVLNSSGGLVASNNDNGPACSGTASSMEVSLSAGTYYVVAEGNGSAYGNIRMYIDACPPAGLTAGMGPLKAVDWGVIKLGYFNSGAANTVTGCYKSHYNGQPSDDKWYKFTVVTPLTVEVNTCYSNFDTYLSILDANLNLMASSDDNPMTSSCPGNTSFIRISLAPGTYYIVGEGYQNTSGTNLTINMEVPWQLPADGNPALAAVPSADQNYITTYTPRIAGVIDEQQYSTASTYQVNADIAYFDGLGRPLQTVHVKSSPLAKDIVQPVAYDQFGRETVKYLPYALTTGTAGAYNADALSPGAGVFKFYNPTGSGTSGGQQNNGVVITPTPYAQTVLESSPMNRVLEQGAPGDDWQPAVTPTTGHTVKTEDNYNNILLLTDTANTRLAARYDVTINADQSRTLTLNGSYEAGQLYITISKDENWKDTGSGNSRGGTTEEYKDKEGHVVLKRTFNWKASPVPAKLEILSTYYVYDDLGKLAFVLPPGANPDAGLSSAANQTTLDNLCYQYRYDERKRLTQKKLPGKGWEYLVYNKLNQPVFRQDVKQRSTNQWTVTKYDALGRVIITGLWNAGSLISQATLQASIYAGAQWDKRDDAGNTVVNPTGYILASYPLLSKVLSVNYYDDYTNIPGLPVGYQPAAGTYSNMTKGLPVAAKVAVLNTIPNASPDYLWTASYYDDQGRIIRSYKQHYLGGTTPNINNYDEIASTYNFTGQVTTSIRKHYTSAGTLGLKLTINNRLIYDHMGRLLKTWQQVQNQGQVADIRTLLGKNDYNEIGQLQTKSLHSTDSTAFLQSVGYQYNERGWLRAANAPLFAYRLDYNTGVNKNYNGNIGHQYWGVPGNLNAHYDYSYDQLNRLKAGSSTLSNNETDIVYDLMGNITNLSRYTAGVLTDRLSYLYNNNQVQSITDNSGSDTGLKNGTATYAYDDNGNLKADNSKGITNIDYNLLNLPQTVAGKSTTYTYDAAGQKLRRVIGSATTDYIDGIQYDGTTGATSSITFIQTSEGRALTNGAVTYNYEYTLSDHLGNSRMSFDKNPTGGTARMVQSDDYYPFGLEISKSVNGIKNNYLYNKKELQENLGFYDYGARFYDPVIARWTSVDPLAEKYQPSSPYEYVANNPLKFVDQDGNEITIPNSADRAQIVGNINKLSRSQYAVNAKTGQLYMTKNINKSGSTYYSDRLNAAIGKSDIIEIQKKAVMEDKMYPGNALLAKDVDKQAGGGITEPRYKMEVLTDKDGNETLRTTTRVVVSGNAYAGMKDENGKIIPESVIKDINGGTYYDDAARILMHELIGHAIPLIVGRDTGNAIENENKVNKELPKGRNKQRAADPSHVEY